MRTRLSFVSQVELYVYQFSLSAVRHLTRRQLLLGSVGTGVLSAGCLSSKNPIVDPEDRQRQHLSEYSSTETLRKGTYQVLGYKFDLPAELTVRIEVIDGGPIDILTLEASEFSAYRSDMSFEHINGASDMGVRRSTLSVRFDPGAYTVVVDNTEQGRTSPGDGDETRVSYSVKIDTYVV